LVILVFILKLCRNGEFQCPSGFEHLWDDNEKDDVENAKKPTAEGTEATTEQAAGYDGSTNVPAGEEELYFGVECSGASCGEMLDLD
jgi:hypothetical protein